MKSRTVARVVRVALVALCAIIGVVLLVMGRHVLGAVVLVGGAGLLGMGTQVLGDPHDIHGLPAGVSAADIKAYRRAHRGATISDAIRALGGDAPGGPDRDGGPDRHDEGGGNGDDGRPPGAGQ
ncbi:hypothetical protein FAM23868_000365 [Propionibacterium freudenreichii]|uniref:hypothetical protein n=1 Tax=Propionibacterium freudenreichii TaxID=1744 RepID=UPI00254ED33F|nr:hypothetical protein [Propionibacterium freudenreichii]MDK9331088.1 hypothetical protein [Propionibacterium freudenreichii]